MAQSEWTKVEGVCYKVEWVLKGYIDPNRLDGGEVGDGLSII